MGWGALAPPAWAQNVATVPATGSTIRLPALGESASEDLSVAAERRVGDQVMREGRRDPQYLDDPVLLEYLQGLWNALLSAARAKGDIDPEVDRAFAWEAFLVKDRSVNAFAMPGGFVGVHLGLIAIATTVDQLASVLAHELTHVTQRHIARSIAPQQRASLLALAGMLLAIAVAGRSNSADGANAALMGSQAVALQSQLNFSRDVEREADRIGFGVLGAAGFSTAGMAAMFERLDIANRLNDNNGFPYLRSHPLTVDRVSEARNRTLYAGVAAPPPTLLHALMQARARVMMDDSVQALRRHNGASSSALRTDRVAALYAAALAASLLNEHSRAQSLAEQALALQQATAPAEATYLQGERASERASEQASARVLMLLQVQLQLARGDAGEAMATLSALEATQPAGSSAVTRPPLLLRAQALLLASNAPERQSALRESTEALQTWLADQPQDAAAWEALAGTAQALGLRLRGLRAGAEARAVLGDINGAIDRLRAAQQGTRAAAGPDFIEASVIDARLRHLVAQRRQLALEAREGRGGARSGPEDGPPQ